MSDIETTRDEELALLKERADLMGIKYSKAIGIDALKAKINEKLESSEIQKEEKQLRNDIRREARKEQLKLVRIRLSVMNPNKQAWRGEVFTFANTVLGTVKKFIPFGSEFYVNGYHVPYCIYTLLKNKTYLSIQTKTVKGQIIVTKKILPEFSIEVLPQLTTEELQELAKEQAAGNRIDLTDSSSD